MTSPIEMHPEACTWADRETRALREAVAHKLPPREPVKPQDADRYIAAEIGEPDIIGPITSSQVDPLGNPLDRWMYVSGKQVGLATDSFARFVQFCRKLQAHTAFQDRVSLSFIEDRTFEWLIRARGDNQPYAKYIQDEAKAAQRTSDYWVPIAHLRIASPIGMGRVTFQRITGQMLDSLQASLQTHNEGQRKGIEIFIERQRKRLQGYTAGTIRVDAELDRGRELAFEKVEMALSMLRFFELSSMDPAFTSYVVPLGTNAPGSRTVFTVTNGVPGDWQEGLIGGHRTIDSLYSPDYIRQLPALGLLELSAILQKGTWTKYEQRLMEALQVYSRVSISEQLSDKLVYALVALESLFLRNRSEPIQSNLAERIALLVNRDLDSRKATIRLFSEIYGIRSALLHHARKVSDDQKIAEFLPLAWSALRAVIRNAERFAEIDGLLTALDEQKLS